MRHHKTSTGLLVLVAGAGGGCATGGGYSGAQIVSDLEREYRPREPAQTAPEAAASPAAGPITLAGLLELAEARNPDLAIALLEVGIAASDVWQASLYPNPRIEVHTEDLSLDDGPADGKVTVGFVQPVILGDRREAAVRAAEVVQAARVAEVEARRRRLFGDIAVAYAKLLALDDQERLYEELRGLVDGTLGVAEARLAARAAPETDVIRPRVERHRINATLSRLAQERQAVARQLGLLIGGVDLGDLSLNEATPLAPEPIGLTEVEAEVRTHHPALIAADRVIDAAVARTAQLAAERVPDLDVSAAAGYRGEEGDAVVELGAGMTVPLWDDRRGEAAGLRLQVLRARQERASIENALLAELASAIGEYESARVQLREFQDSIVPDALRAFEQTTQGYQAGRSSFLELFDAQRTLAEARIAVVELAGAAAVARARILQIAGPEALSGPSMGLPSPGEAVESIPSEVRPVDAEVEP